MAAVRVLIVDDAVVCRRLLSDLLAQESDVAVVGTAAHGRIALAMIPQVNPDLVILDVEMPEMDGLATLVEIRKRYPQLPVLMFSALTERGAATTLDALLLGASDYITKPEQLGSLGQALESLRGRLVPQIKALCRGDGRPARPTPTPTTPSHVVRPQPHPVEVLAIGASTGGPNALADIFQGLPARFPVPVVLVQHMPPLFTRSLAERLTAKSSLAVAEGHPGGLLRPGHVWVAPGDFHMIVARDGAAVRVFMHQDEPQNSCRPAVDVLFRSVAQVFGPGVLAIVLTGMGADGLRGCEAIRDAGGQILVQDEATSVVWGMAGSVANRGLADRVVPLEHLSGEILRRVRHTHTSPGAGGVP